MSFKDYIDEHQKVLDEHDRIDESEELDERVALKKYIDKNGMVKSKHIETDPNKKVINHKDGSYKVKIITPAERANLERKKGVKGTKSRRKQKKNLKKHYELIGGPDRSDTGDIVYNRNHGKHNVLSDKTAADKRKKKAARKKAFKQFGKAAKDLAGKIVDKLVGGPKKIWNG